MAGLCALGNEHQNKKECHDQSIDIGKTRLLQLEILSELSSPAKGKLVWGWDFFA